MDQVSSQDVFNNIWNWGATNVIILKKLLFQQQFVSVFKLRLPPCLLLLNIFWQQLHSAAECLMRVFRLLLLAFVYATVSLLSTFICAVHCCTFMLLLLLLLLFCWYCHCAGITAFLPPSCPLFALFANQLQLFVSFFFLYLFSTLVGICVCCWEFVLVYVSEI